MPKRPELPKVLKDYAETHPPYCDRPQKPPVSESNAETDLEKFKLSLRKHDPKQHGLPWACQSLCHECDEIVPARFEQVDGQVVHVRECPQHGISAEAHQDTIFSKQCSDRKESPEYTHGGVRIQPILRGLPRTVETLCPECSCVILGRYYEQDGQVWIEKTCPDHGYFRDKISSDVKLYLKGASWSWDEGAGQVKQHVKGSTRCPTDCGLCSAHQSTSVLSQIELTTRCNLRCPVCWANAGATGRVCEMPYDQAVQLLEQLRDMRPIPSTSVQFTGGEPTLHPRFLDLVRKARQMGFSHVQAATNGLTFANEEFVARAVEAGLHDLYLQFDGVGDESYRQTRGEAVWERKLAAIENCRKYDLKICLVPTIIKGVNSDQVPRIVQFASHNVDVIGGISFQPVCFSGRINHKERLAKRYTLADLAHDCCKAIPESDAYRDFYPLTFTQPISKIFSAQDGLPKIETNCHTDCGFGTYLLVSQDHRPYTFPMAFDMEGLFTDLYDLAQKIHRKCRAGKMTLWDKFTVYRIFKRRFRPETAPPDITPGLFINTLIGCVNKQVGRGKSPNTYKSLLCAGMHFQDRYNFDVERIKRCVILYGTRDGIYPFCTYNGGPMYRTFFERQYSQTTDEWQREHPDLPVRPSCHPRAVMPWADRFGADVDEPMYTPELEARLEKMMATYATDDWMNGNGRRGGNGNGRK
ncbi:MAG: radical SAM protein [Phycisphaerae bacterium]|nr:radical SAM protein [Phycisphaerae bacterium]